jgi:phosphatidylglycerol---prolipoprotein diacylglyceryl transferase
VRPVLYDLFGIPISSFGVFLLVAFFIGITRARQAAQAQLGLDPNQTLDLSLYAIIAGIIGGRAGYIFANAGQFIIDPSKMLTIWRDGGLVFYGALVAALFLARAFARRWNVSFGALLDAYAPGLVIGYGIAMIGALLHGLFPGRPTGVPWGVEMFLERRHPTQLYLMIASFGILATLRAQRRQQLAPGTLFTLAILLLSIARFVADFFIEAPPVAGPLTAGQIASAVVAIVSGVILFRLQGAVPAEVSAERLADGPDAESPVEVST